MTVCPFQLYCINYHVLAYQKILCRGLQRFFNPESNACRLMDKNSLGRLQNLVSPRVPFLTQHSSSFIINDFPSCINNDVSIFADDTTVYTIGLPINQNATAISLTADLNNADLWARIWGMLFNADKSEILSIRSQRAALLFKEAIQSFIQFL